MGPAHDPRPTSSTPTTTAWPSAHRARSRDRLGTVWEATAGKRPLASGAGAPDARLRRAPPSPPGSLALARSEALANGQHLGDLRRQAPTGERGPAPPPALAERAPQLGGPGPVRSYPRQPLRHVLRNATFTV